MKCRICGCDTEHQTYDAREMMFGYRDAFRYFQCSKCRCLQITNYPPHISNYYPDNYYSFQPISCQKRIKRCLLRMRDRYAFSGRGLIGKLLYSKYPRSDLWCLSLLPIEKDTKILDVGCGAGALLYSLRGFGMTNLLGVDPFNAKHIQYENGLTIHKKGIHDIEGQWDMVMFHHSFEHIPDPAGTLEAVYGLLTPDGHCVIRIPTVSSYAWKHYGVNWAQLDAPRHLYLHSVDSMNILAEQAGLDLQKIVYDSTSFQFWGSEQYIKDIPLRDNRSYAVNPKASIFSKKEISAFAKRAEELNEIKQGDQAIFYLRKCKNRPAK
jgi:2-polyprenyl-3-methyl-5-hydroxy-6-metoxy-1,4-benzoquinol methylase